MKTTATYHNLSFTEAKTYLFATLFIAGNIILPQLAHFVPNGGPMLLPIYFFTLIAAYRFGIQTGMLTAILSPVINSLLFGMPMLAMLPIILIKSSLLAIAASSLRGATLRSNLIENALSKLNVPSLRGATLRSKLNAPSLRGAQRRSNLQPATFRNAESRRLPSCFRLLALTKPMAPSPVAAATPRSRHRQEKRPRSPVRTG